MQQTLNPLITILLYGYTFLVSLHELLPNALLRVIEIKIKRRPKRKCDCRRAIITSAASLFLSFEVKSALISFPHPSRKMKRDFFTSAPGRRHRRRNRLLFNAHLEYMFLSGCSFL